MERVADTSVTAGPSALNGRRPARSGAAASCRKQCGLPPWRRRGDPLALSARRTHNRAVPEMSAVRVLLVDDQPAYLRAMAAVVGETDGFEVVGRASSGEECVDIAVELAPHLVLMDVNLPGIDGMEATRRLREVPSSPVVLLLSTYDEDAGALFVAESGAAAYLSKSRFGPDQLGEAWSAAIG